MLLVNPRFSILTQENTVAGIYKIIERVGRVAYKSEDNITLDSAKPFLKKLRELGHLSPLEFATVYLQIPTEEQQCVKFFLDNEYSRVSIAQSYAYVTSNFRVLVESNNIGYLRFLDRDYSAHEDLYLKRIAVHMVLSRGIANEFVRHRKFSFMQESTRFCNYSKNRFCNECTFIIPYWMRDKFKECRVKDVNYIDPPKGDETKLIGELTIVPTNGSHELPQVVTCTPAELNYISACIDCENNYLDLLREKVPAQFARDVLPLGLKTELCMCGFVTDWIAFFSLRSPAHGAVGVHPDAGYLADALLSEMFPKLRIKPF